MSDPLLAKREVTLLEILERVLDKGVVIAGDLTISVAGVDLIYLGLRALLCSVETMEQARHTSAECRLPPLATPVTSGQSLDRLGMVPRPLDRLGVVSNVEPQARDGEPAGPAGRTMSEVEPWPEDSVPSSLTPGPSPLHSALYTQHS